MQFMSLYADVQGAIVLSNLSKNPFKVTASELKKCYTGIVDHLCISKSISNSIQTVCQARLKELKEIYSLSIKYFQYNSDYEDPDFGYIGLSDRLRETLLRSGNPHLYDALSTGLQLPLVRPSFKIYNHTIEADIKRMVQLMPQSLDCTMGTLRCAGHVTPLYMACCNPHIPLHIVAFLLENKADINAGILVSGYRKDILEHLTCALARDQPDRLAQISALFAAASLPK